MIGQSCMVSEERKSELLQWQWRPAPGCWYPRAENAGKWLDALLTDLHQEGFDHLVVLGDSLQLQAANSLRCLMNRFGHVSHVVIRNSTLPPTAVRALDSDIVFLRSSLEMEILRWYGEFEPGANLLQPGPPGRGYLHYDWQKIFYDRSIVFLGSCAAHEFPLEEAEAQLREILIWAKQSGSLVFWREYSPAHFHTADSEYPIRPTWETFITLLCAIFILLSLALSVLIWLRIHAGPRRWCAWSAAILGVAIFSAWLFYGPVSVRFRQCSPSSMDLSPAVIAERRLCARLEAEHPGRFRCLRVWEAAVKKWDAHRMSSPSVVDCRHWCAYGGESDVPETWAVMFLNAVRLSVNLNVTAA